MSRVIRWACDAGWKPIGLVHRPPTLLLARGLALSPSGAETIYYLPVVAHLERGGVIFELFAPHAHVSTKEMRHARRPGWAACLKAWVESDLDPAGVAWSEDELMAAVWQPLGETEVWDDDD